MSSDSELSIDYQPSEYELKVMEKRELNQQKLAELGFPPPPPPPKQGSKQKKQRAKRVDTVAGENVQLELPLSTL